MPDRTTQFGFTFGSLEVTRLMVLDDGRVVLRVQSTHSTPIDIYASPAGRSVRVFRNGKELKGPSGKGVTS